MNKQENKTHVSVLLKEAVEALAVQSGKWYVDATLGFGGHTEALLKHGAKVLGIDQDRVALAASRIRLGNFPQSDWQLVHANFKDLKKVVEQAKIQPQGVLFDLGVSSYQIDGNHRGFSFQADEPLDMRMNPQVQTVTAKDVVNSSYEKELEKIITIYGEDPLAHVIANRIVSTRGQRSIETTRQLAEIIEHVYSSAYRGKSKRHPATKTFQALRIYVNDEMESLKIGLRAVLDVLDHQGRCVVISFHGLEDRIVKRQFKAWKQAGHGKVITKKPIIPTQAEIDQNPRSRSAKLRVFEKI